MTQSKGYAGVGRNADTSSAMPGHPADKKSGKGEGSAAAAYRSFDQGGQAIPGMRLDKIPGFEHCEPKKRRRRK